jgi:acyl-coenzyme A thioesterase PaaI-like protein
MHVVEFDAGQVELRVPRQRIYDGVFESFHGGLLMTAADLRVKARVIKRGRLLCPVGVDLFDEAGTLVAVAQVNYMLLSQMPRR